MSQQSFFGTVSLTNGASSVVSVDLGFTPGRIELINLSAVKASPHVATTVWKALWQYGMGAGASGSGTAILTAFGASATFLDTTTYTDTNGILLLNQLGSEQGAYGASISGFTNANPGVITVNSTANASITAGCIIRVANVADNQGGTQSLNGDYYVASVTSTTVVLGTAPAGLWSQTTLSGKDTSAYSTYVSGGFVTVLQNANATTPNPPNNIYSNVPSWYNEAIQGFSIGTSVFTGAGTTDVILVSAWDAMQP